MATLKLHSDRWDDDRSVLPFLKNVAPEQIGPDDARLTFSVQFVKQGNRKPFVRTEWRLELETKVRSLDVARWALDRMSEVSDLRVEPGSKTGLDEIGLALRIEDATKGLDRGPMSDSPTGDGDDSGSERAR